MWWTDFLLMKIANVPSNLRIVDYFLGMTGSAHDAVRHPEWFFDRDEFAWTDSAYTVNSRTILVHKQSAPSFYENTV